MKNAFGRITGAVLIAAGLFGCATRPDASDSTAAPANAIAPAAPLAGRDSGNVQVASAQPIVPSDSLAPKAAPWGDGVIATIGTANRISISMAELIQPLVESHGLDMLLNIVQRDLARQGAEEDHVTVTPADFKIERQRTLDILFYELDSTFQDRIDAATKANHPTEVKRLEEEKEEEHQQLLKQFFEQKHLTETDFDIVLQTNAYLRKIADPKVEGKITEKMLHDEFGARYGEKVRVRHIELNRVQDVADVQRRLAAGERFDLVARDMSKNPDAAIGGEMLPFTREAPLPAVFKEVAFKLTVGQVSDLISVDNTYQLIKLEERIPPNKAVVFEQQRDILYRDVHEKFVQAVVAEMRRNIAGATRTLLKISDPVLNKQFQERLDALNATARGKDAAVEELAKERDRRKLEEDREARRLAVGASTQPSTTVPASAATTAPALTPRPVSAPRSAPAIVAPVPPAPATRSAAPTTLPAATLPPALRAVPPATRPG